MPLPAPVTIAILFFSRESIGGTDEYLISSCQSVLQEARPAFAFDQELPNGGRDWLG
jgi:hypothetical protein